MAVSLDLSDFQQVAWKYLQHPVGNKGRRHFQMSGTSTLKGGLYWTSPADPGRRGARAEPRPGADCSRHVPWTDRCGEREESEHRPYLA